jgi:hypothetical protein
MAYPIMWRPVLCAIVFVCALSTHAQVIGSYREVSIEGQDVANALGAEVWKYEYRLKRGKYDVDLWLESWDRGSSTPRRLTYGTGTCLEEITGGDVVLSVMDPATTESERGKVWRFGQYHAFKGPKVFSRGAVLLDNPLRLHGGGSKGESPKGDIRSGSDIALITWGSGAHSTTAGVHEHNLEINDVTLYLKMRVSPQKEPNAKHP